MKLADEVRQETQRVQNERIAAAKAEKIAEQEKALADKAEGIADAERAFQWHLSKIKEKATEGDNRYWCCTDEYRHARNRAYLDRLAELLTEEGFKA